VEPNALHSLYGAKTALSGNVGGQERIQETWSPDWIVEAAREALGGTITLDPCAASDPDGWFAEENWTLPPEARELEAVLRATKDKKLRSKTLKLLRPHWTGGGIARHWGALGCSAYVNPPFALLEEWMRKCQEQAERGVAVVLLTPVRPHREWWLPIVRTGRCVCLRYDVKFKGHTQAFPAPLALVSWNCTIPSLGARETGRF
jgi:hypothetical protein